MVKSIGKFEYIYIHRHVELRNGTHEGSMGVEKWTQEQIRNFITRPDVVKHSDGQGLIYENTYMRMFITRDLKAIVLNEGNVIDF